MHGIEQAERLRHAPAQIGLAILVRLHAADIDVPKIEGRMPTHYPFGQRHAGAASGLDADRIEARGDIEIFQTGRFAQQIALIGREALRAIEELADPGLGQLRHPM